MSPIRSALLGSLLFAAGSAFATSASAQCTNTCATANDGECDDGGPGSLYNVCGLGTDCNDCGPRAGAAPTPPAVTPPPAVAPPPAVGGTACTNTCATANDGECDDGGPGSMYSICELGSDCNDCGARAAAAPPVAEQTAPAAQWQAMALCANTCSSANDGECDDGGAGSMYSVCTYGTDCADCGARRAADGPNTGGLCANTCTSANDGECDDGGPGSMYSICDLGTDCDDCGRRQPVGGMCTNTCSSANDGECDDGGPNSVYSICALGTDCNDCGAR